MNKKKYTFKEYKSMLDWPHPRKIHYAEVLLRENIEKGKTAVSFSGGKSSLVALHLSLQVCSDLPVLYNNTGVALPGIPQFIRSLSERWHFTLVETHPETSFWEIVDEHGYPHVRGEGKGKPLCCYYLKEKPLGKEVEKHGWKALVTGVQAVESMQRRLWFMKRGGAYTMKKAMPYPVKKIQPLSPWTDEDVWRYIKQRDLPYWKGYDEYDIERTGCLPCTGFTDWEEKMQKMSPALYAKVKREKDDQKLLRNCFEDE